MAKFQPYVVSDPASIVGGVFGRVVVLAASFEAVRAVQRAPMPPGMIGVRDRVIMNAQLKAFAPLDPKDYPLQSVIADIKNDMLLHGATPEAVMLIGAVSPFSKKELNTMAEKLKKAATKKTSTKKAPAKKAEASGGGGSRTTLDEKAKITATDKGKAKLEKVGKDDNLAIMVKAKTVGKALEGGVATKDIHYAARTGLVEVG